MVIFYLIALVPLLIGGVLWVFRDEINLVEWLGATVAAFILAAIFNAIAIHGMTDDIETWSGKLVSARHFPAWKEYYEYAVYRTEYYTDTEYYRDSKGRTCSRTVTKSRQVFDHWEPDTRWHSEHWQAYSDIDTTYDIDGQTYAYLTGRYQNEHAVEGVRHTMDHNSRMLEGDPNDYVIDWYKTRWIQPVTKVVHWQNKVKAAPSVFSFIKVPTNVPVFSWPKNPDPFSSERVMGTAGQYINVLKWDQLNAELGAAKKINLIVIGLGADSMLGQYQRAKFVGGKKNDLVICAGGDNLHKPTWALVFGWTDSELVKQDIQGYVMEHGLDDSFCDYLKKEVVENYRIKEWKKFDYIRVEPATKYYWYYFICLLIVEGGLYWWFFVDEFDKEGKERSLFARWAGRSVSPCAPRGRNPWAGLS